jgi:HAD superfamily hydrolase (TIGR01509 family)
MTAPLSDAEKPILLLDAMGVIYRVGDDVPDLLVPFIREKGGIDDSATIEALYRAASLGQLTAVEFWRRVGVSPELEDEYLARFELSPGLPELLQRASSRFQSVACLSNDVSEWSLKLRRRFCLEPYFVAWYISGDLKLRKPDPRIYAHVAADLGVAPERIVFVDDRIKNLDPAAELGMVAILYPSDADKPDNRHRTIHRLTELLA